MALPTIHVTDAAKQAIAAAIDAGSDTALRVDITPRFKYQLRLDVSADGDVIVEEAGVRICLDPESAERADGMTIDFVASEEGGGFSIENPNVPPAIRQISADELKAMIADGRAFELVDVRTQGEREIARIEGARLLDQALHDELMKLDRNTAIVFQCHHGMRSQSAAEYFLAAGFRNLHNLQGGIDAWSQQVDPSVPRY